MSTERHDTATPENPTAAYQEPSLYRFSDQRHATNPFDVWKQFRETPGLARSEQDGGFWILSRFEEVRRAATQEKTFCARRGRLIPGHAGSFLPSDSDGALHRQYRRILNRWLTEEAVAPFEPQVHAICAGILSGLANRQEFDMSQEYTIQTILLAGITWLGWPAQDGKFLAAWAHDILAEEDVAGPGASERAWAALHEYVTRFIAQRRAESPRDDIIQAILDTEIEGRPVTDDEVSQLVISVFLGAVLTTASTLSASFQYLADHPEARDLLRSEPDRLETAVEEFLRVGGTVVYLARTVEEDTEMAGCPMHKGEKVAMLFSSANRDPAEFPDPDDVILDRTPNRHMAFGHGPHKCAGAPFARMVLRVSIQEALAHLGEFRIADETTVKWETSTNRLVVSLPVIHEPRPV
jgi:cytochrome P450